MTHAKRSSTPSLVIRHTFARFLDAFQRIQTISHVLSPPSTLPCFSHLISSSSSVQDAQEILSSLRHDSETLSKLFESCERDDSQPSLEKDQHTGTTLERMKLMATGTRDKKQTELSPSHSSFISKDKKKLYRFLWTAVDLLRYSPSSSPSNNKKKMEDMFTSASIDHIEIFQFIFSEISSIEYLKRAMSSLRHHQTILEILTVSFLENLRNFQQLISSIYPRPPVAPTLPPTPSTASHFSSSKSPMTQRNEKIFFDYQVHVLTLQLGKLCHHLLTISDTLHELSQQSIGVEGGIHCYELFTERDHTKRALGRYMNHQRVHTCHNYLLTTSAATHHLHLQHSSCSSSLLFNEIKTTEVYHTLFQRHLETEGIPFSSSPSSTPVFGPSQQNKCKETKKRIESFSSCHQFWWWDALETCDWDLFRVMVSDILQEESSVGIESLVVELIRSHAPSDIIHHLVR
jgi:hypothetical protein